MKRGRPKKIIEQEKLSIQPISVKSEKEKLLELYEQLKSLKINRISELENLIARAE